MDAETSTIYQQLKDCFEHLNTDVWINEYRHEIAHFSALCKEYKNVKDKLNRVWSRSNISLDTADGIAAFIKKMEETYADKLVFGNNINELHRIIGVMSVLVDRYEKFCNNFIK